MGWPGVDLNPQSSSGQTVAHPTEQQFNKWVVVTKNQKKNLNPA